MKYLFIFAVTLIPLRSISQVDTIQSEQLEIQFDSIVVSLWDIHFKELDAIGDSGFPSRILAQTVLNQSQAEDLFNHLKNPNSYDGERANLSHHDIEIHVYLNGKANIEIELSALTGNIDIENQLNAYYFRNNCSKDFGEYILSTLREENLLEIAGYDELDIEGLK